MLQFDVSPNREVAEPWFGELRGKKRRVRWQTPVDRTQATAALVRFFLFLLVLRMTGWRRAGLGWKSWGRPGAFPRGCGGRAGVPNCLKRGGIWFWIWQPGNDISCSWSGHWSSYWVQLYCDIYPTVFWEVIPFSQTAVFEIVEFYLTLILPKD